MRIRLTLSIGYAGARHEDEIEIDDPEPGLEGDALIEWLHSEYWVDWANGYIDGGVEIVEAKK
jgi:hypothetical protein